MAEYSIHRGAALSSRANPRLVDIPFLQNPPQVVFGEKERGLFVPTAKAGTYANSWLPFQAAGGCGKPLETPIDNEGLWPYTTVTVDVLSVCRHRIPKGPRGSFGILL